MPYAVSGPVAQSSINANLNWLSTYNVKKWNMPDCTIRSCIDGNGLFREHFSSAAG